MQSASQTFVSSAASMATLTGSGEKVAAELRSAREQAAQLLSSKESLDTQLLAVRKTQSRVLLATVLIPGLWLALYWLLLNKGLGH
jgi:hypothetical protein